MKPDYNKQRLDLQNMAYSKKIDSIELIELIIQAREQRDTYKKERIILTKKYIDTLDKLRRIDKASKELLKHIKGYEK
jgi:hypothetical protein